MKMQGGVGRLLGSTCLAAAGAAVMAASIPTDAQAIYLSDRAARDLGFENVWDRDNRYPAVVSIGTPGGNNYCTGTLIDSRTILTASHCLANDDTKIGGHLPGTVIRFAPDMRQSTANDRGVSGGLIHPQYDSHVFAEHDIALITLADPVTDIAPVRLAPQGDAMPEFGETLRIIGYGTGGTAGNLIVDDNTIRRFAEMSFGELTDLGEIGSPLAHPVIVTQFRDPDSPDDPDAFDMNEDGIPTPRLQGSAAPGDSGGPIFMERDGELIQIGTVIGGFFFDRIGDPRIPDYGILNLYSPLSIFGDWVLANAAYRSTTAAAGDWNWSDADAWTDALDRSEVPDNVDGSFDGRGQMGRFYGVNLFNAGSMTLDMNATIDDLNIDNAEASLTIPTDRSLEVVTWTDLEAGELAVHGRLRTGVVRANGGTILGTGTIETAFGLANEAAVVMPGTADTATALTIAGNYWQGPAGTLWTRIGDTGVGTLRVDDTAMLDGTLRLTRQGGLVVPERAYSVVDAGTGIRGEFATVDAPFAFLAADVAYGATAATARFSRNEVAFSDVATTDNQRATAGALESTNPNSRLHRHIVNADTQEAVRAFSQLSPEVHGSATTVLTSQANMVRAMLTERVNRGAQAMQDVPWMGYASYGEPASMHDPAGVKLGGWAMLNHVWGQVGSDGNAGRLRHDTTGIFGGIGAEQADAWKAGILFGYSTASFSLRDQAASGDAETFHLGAHGAVSLGRIEFSGGLLHAWHDLEVARSISLPEFSTTANADYDARTLQAFGEAAYHVDFGNLRLSPHAGLAVVNHRTDAFVDDGGIARLAVARSSRTQTISTVGVRGEASLMETQGLEIRGRAGIGWQHAFGRLAPVATASFDGSPAFGVAGLAADRNTLSLTTGLGALVGESVRLDVDYAAQLGDRVRDHSVRGKLSVSF